MSARHIIRHICSHTEKRTENAVILVLFYACKKTGQLEAATQTKERNRLAREIQMVIDNAHKAGIWAGICGELGADTSLTNIFIKTGIDELSVSPGCILPVRKAIRDAE